MRISCSILLLLFLTATGSAQVTNQRLFDTVGFMVDHYAKRVAYFESQPIAKGSIVFIGNSITEAGKWRKLTGDSAVFNRGVSGDITFGVLKRLDEVIAARPSKVFLLIGINDIGKDIPDAVIADNIRKIIERFAIESPSTKLYVHSLLPVNPTVKNFPQHYDKNEHVRDTNKLVNDVVRKAKVSYVDIFKIFSDKDGLLLEQFTPDGLHLNAQGYTRWLQHLRSIKAL